MSNSPLLFIHLTKTAGGSFKEILRSNVGDRSIFYNEPGLLPSVQPQHKVIFGHFHFGLHADLNLLPDYGCVLRHPITRTISHYYHLYNHEEGPIGNAIRKGGKDINDFFSRSYHWEFENFMCKMLSGLEAVDSPKLANTQENVYQLAIANVNQFFSFIGFFEYLDLSLLSLAKKLSLRIDNLPRINTGKYNLSSVSEETIQRICELNYYDIVFYREVLNRFITRLQ